MARGDYLRDVLASGRCPRCKETKADIDEQYSYGVYAGVMCTACARAGYTDQCGFRPQGQGDVRELDDCGEADLEPTESFFYPDDDGD